MIWPFSCFVLPYYPGIYPLAVILSIYRFKGQKKLCCVIIRRVARFGFRHIWWSDGSLLKYYTQLWINQTYSEIGYLAGPHDIYLYDRHGEIVVIALMGKWGIWPPASRWPLTTKSIECIFTWINWKLSLFVVAIRPEIIRLISVVNCKAYDETCEQCLVHTGSKYLWTTNETRFSS